jgi:30S ribosomal protein S31
MGKGDKKSRRGKIHIGTYGVKRPRNKAKSASAAAPAKKEGKKSASKASKKSK